MAGGPWMRHKYRNGRPEGEYMERRMIKVKRGMVFLAVLCIFTGFGCFAKSSPDVLAAGKKGGISYTVKKGTLTISGKGALTSKVRVADQKKIKKIIVKRGITALPVSAFESFKNVQEIEIASSVRKMGDYALPCGKRLEKVTMPGKFQYVRDEEDPDYIAHSLINERWHIDTICFNSPLSLKTLSFVKSNHLIVSKKDKNYRSIGGVIYSKDGKSIVRVPAYRKSLTVADGCEEFCTQSVEYGKMYGLVDSDSECELACHDLKKIVLPASVRRINTNKYYAVHRDYSRVNEIRVKSEQLSDRDILLLLDRFKVKKKDFLGQFDYISYQDDMYVNTREASIFSYEGEAEEFEVPAYIKAVGVKAFEWSNLKRVTIPDSVTRIGAGAFNHCEKLQEVRLPDAMTKIPDKMFQYCYSLKEITLPQHISVIGMEAFRETDVTPSILSQAEISEIQSYAFYDVGWEQFELPKTIRKVGGAAFAMGTLRRVTICGDTGGISPWAFGKEYGQKKPILIFLANIGHWQTGMEINGWSKDEIFLMWQDVAGVDGWQIQVAPDKAFHRKKTYYARKGEMKKDITKLRTRMRYARIRPWKTIDGRKQYGRWTTDCTDDY